MTLSGAEYLAQIYGTDKDRVNCSFYFKIGACRHGEQCSKLHNKPRYSQTLLLKNLYSRSQRYFTSLGHCTKEVDDQRSFDGLFEEVFVELEDCYGQVDELNICDNDAEHMAGNVYVKFRHEQDAIQAEECLNNRWFGGRPIYAELSPVTDFRDACCRQYEMGECTRGGFCNFMHLKPISHFLRRRLYNRKMKKRKTMKLKKNIAQKSPKYKTLERSCFNASKLPKAYQLIVESSSSDSESSDQSSESNKLLT